MLPSHSLHQLLVQFTNQPDGKGELVEARNAVLQRGHIVADLAEILRASLDYGAGFGSQQFAERSLRAFDLAGQDRLTTHERAHRDVRIEEAPAFTRKSANQPVGFGEYADQSGRSGKGWRQWGGHEGGVSVLWDEFAGDVGFLTHRSGMKTARCTIFDLYPNRK